MEQDSQITQDKKTRLTEFHFRHDFLIIICKIKNKSDQQDDLIENFKQFKINLNSLSFCPPITFLEFVEGIRLAFNVSTLGLTIFSTRKGDEAKTMNLLNLFNQVTELILQFHFNLQYTPLFLTSLQNLKYLQIIASNFTENNLKQLFLSVQSLNNLAYFDIEQINLDYIYCLAKVQLFEQFIQKIYHFEGLSFNLKIKDESIIHTEIFQNCWKDYKNLRSLSLTISSSLINGLLNSLRHISSLNKLNLQIQGFISEEISLIIGQAISQQQNLNYLNIILGYFHNTGNKCMKNLVKMFKNKQKLTYLKFVLNEYQEITDKEVYYLFKGIQELKNLQKIFLGLLENKIEFENIKLLYNILVEFKELREVCVDMKSLNSIYLNLLQVMNKSNLSFQHYYKGYLHNKIQKFDEENKLTIMIRDCLQNFEGEILGLYYLIQDFPVILLQLDIKFSKYQILGLNNYQLLAVGISQQKNLKNLTLTFKDSNKNELIEFGNYLSVLNQLTELNVEGDVLYGIYTNLYKFPSLQYLTLIHKFRNIEKCKQFPYYFTCLNNLISVKIDFVDRVLIDGEQIILPLQIGNLLNSFYFIEKLQFSYVYQNVINYEEAQQWRQNQINCSSETFQQIGISFSCFENLKILDLKIGGSNLVCDQGSLLIVDSIKSLQKLEYLKLTLEQIECNCEAYFQHLRETLLSLLNIKSLELNMNVRFLSLSQEQIIQDSISDKFFNSLKLIQNLKILKIAYFLQMKDKLHKKYKQNLLKYLIRMASFSFSAKLKYQ